MEKQKTKIVRIFDLDGTLTNTIGHNYVTTCQTNTHFKLALPLFDHFKDSYDQRDGFRRHLNGLGVPEPLHREYGKKWNELYIRMIRENPPIVIPGAK